MPNTTFLGRIRAAFFTGLMLLAPLAVTLIVFVWLVSQVGGTFSSYFFFWVPADWLGNPRLSLVWDILSTAMVVVFITTLGFVSRWVLGRYFGEFAERFIQGIPGIGAFYNAVRQIVQTFGAENRAAFSKVVLIEFPRAGSYAIGFLTNNSGGEASERTGRDLVSVFVPTTPNPTSGFLLLVPRDEVRELAMSVRDGMKFIISGGAVLPGDVTRGPIAVQQPAAGVPLAK
ncbi:MAG TPA: DUF502 domain-containing protein [Opitutaceae bacterium]|nr:DUF502 domain-containing protein [Opitutaceae bacterium]